MTTTVPRWARRSLRNYDRRMRGEQAAAAARKAKAARAQHPPLYDTPARPGYRPQPAPGWFCVKPDWADEQIDGQTFQGWLADWGFPQPRWVFDHLRLNHGLTVDFDWPDFPDQQSARAWVESHRFELTPPGGDLPAWAPEGALLLRAVDLRPGDTVYLALGAAPRRIVRKTGHTAWQVVCYNDTYDGRLSQVETITTDSPRQVLVVKPRPFGPREQTLVNRFYRKLGKEQAMTEAPQTDIRKDQLAWYNQRVVRVLKITGTQAQIEYHSNVTRDYKKDWAALPRLTAFEPLDGTPKVGDTVFCERDLRTARVTHINDDGWYSLMGADSNLYRADELQIAKRGTLKTEEDKPQYQPNPNPPVVKTGDLVELIDGRQGKVEGRQAGNIYVAIDNNAVSTTCVPSDIARVLDDEDDATEATEPVQEADTQPQDADEQDDEAEEQQPTEAASEADTTGEAAAGTADDVDAEEAPADAQPTLRPKQTFTHGDITLVTGTVADDGSAAVIRRHADTSYHGRATADDLVHFEQTGEMRWLAQAPAGQEHLRTWTITLYQVARVDQMKTIDTELASYRAAGWTVQHEQADWRRNDNRVMYIARYIRLERPNPDHDDNRQREAASTKLSWKLKPAWDDVPQPEPGQVGEPESDPATAAPYNQGPRPQSYLERLFRDGKDKVLAEEDADVADRSYAAMRRRAAAQPKPQRDRDLLPGGAS